MHWIYWLIIIVILAIIEALTTKLVSVWFIASAFISMIISIFYSNLLLQFFIFIVFGILFLIITQYLLNKEKLEALIGEEGKVTKEIPRDSIGEIIINDKKYDAKCDKKIKEGIIVKVIDVDNKVLVVKRVIKKRFKKK